ncbi:MAG: nitrate/nitrite transporter NrtS [Acidimicrobiales bacterium]
MGIKSGRSGFLAVIMQAQDRWTWRGWRQAFHVLSHPVHLRRTSATAVVVGTVLFAINQLNVVVAGQATTVVWLKTGLTYMVPFAVSNIGILIATRR